MIVVNDLFIIIGTICKVTIEFRDFDSDLFTLTGILLGLGALLVYIGILRYLGFFNQYNVIFYLFVFIFKRFYKQKKYNKMIHFYFFLLH